MPCRSNPLLSGRGWLNDSQGASTVGHPRAAGVQGQGRPIRAALVWDHDILEIGQDRLVVLPRATFTGGIAVRGGWRASGPFARLDIGDEDLVIRASPVARKLGLSDVIAIRSETKGTRLSTGALAVRVSVIRSDGTEVEPYFAAAGRARIRTALHERGWPIIEDHWKFGRLEST